jgi:hypothetical protein
MRGIQTVFTDGEGKFAFPGVPVGSYRIGAWGPIFGFGGGDHGPEASPHGKAASMVIDAAIRDMTDLRLELEDLRIVTGRLSGDGGDGCADRARVLLRPVDPLLGAQELSANLNHGAFTIHDVPSGHYRVQLRDLHGSCYVKRVRSGDANLESGIVSVYGNTPVELIMAADSATVSGRVTLPDGKSPSTTAQVVLVTTEDSNPEDSVRFTSSNSEGLFQFDHVPPGDYQVLALRRLDALDYLDPVFRTEHGAARITAKPESLTTIELTLSK